MDLICSEYNFELFCYRLLATDPSDPIAAIDAANGEAWLARRLHRQQHNGADFRRGSRGRRYCEDLARLVRVLMLGEIPAGTSPEFVAAMKPLGLHLLKKYDIGGLRQALA